MVEALKGRLGGEQVQEIAPASASEDVSEFARAWNVPTVYWTVGGTDQQTYEQAEKAGRVNEIPSNHSPEFAPVIEPHPAGRARCDARRGRRLADARRREALTVARSGPALHGEESEVVGRVLLVLGGDGPEVLELVEEALDEVPVAI